MMSTEPPKQRWQIRVLSGPTRGASRVLTGRLSIGREATSDIHLGSGGVSRQHALIVEDGGRHVLIDLASSNGTFADGRSVDRHVLHPNTLFSIVDVDLVYEEVRELPMAAVEPPLVDARNLRPTAELRRCDAMTQDYPSAMDMAAQEASASAGIPLDADGRPLMFDSPDGGQYEGNLVEDIIEYRSLRVQHLRGGFAEPRMRQQFERLRGSLRQPPSSDPRISQRAFCRFGCWFPARIKLADGSQHVCRVRDFGVDGAQLSVEGHALEPNSIVWLTIEIFEGENARSLVLGARIAWVDEPFVGLAFSVAPRRVQGCYAEQPGPAHHDRVSDVPQRRAGEMAGQRPDS